MTIRLRTMSIIVSDVRRRFDHEQQGNPLTNTPPPNLAAPLGDQPVGVPVGREITVESGGSMLDVTVELVARPPGTSRITSAWEPLDKLLIRVRADRRDGGGPPAYLDLESAATRQLAATLTKAADIADDLDTTA